jgi:hypothetical protein
MGRSSRCRKAAAKTVEKMGVASISTKQSSSEKVPYALAQIVIFIWRMTLQYARNAFRGSMTESQTTLDDLQKVHSFSMLHQLCSAEFFLHSKPLATACSRATSSG